MVESLPKGAQQAAALLVGLGAEVAAAVFKQLGESEARMIAQAAPQLRAASSGAVTQALGQFVAAMEKVGSEAAVGGDVLRSALEAARGRDAAERAFEAPRIAPAEALLGPVADADSEALGMVLAREQPQTVALVLAALSPEKAAEVVGHLPEAARPAVVRRMATVESVAPEVLREVQKALTHELQALVSEGMRKVDGRAAALEVLRRTAAADQAAVLADIEKDDADLAAELRAKLFTFEDLLLLADRDIQQLLKEVDAKRLTAALKGASSEVRQKFLRNMSQRAAELLNDDLAALGPVKLSAVESAQAEIASRAVALAEKGQITIVRATDKMV